MGGLHFHGKDIYTATGSTQWYRLYDYNVDSSALIRLAIGDHVFNGTNLKDNLHKLALSSARNRFKKFDKYYSQSSFFPARAIGHSYDGKTNMAGYASFFSLCLGGIPSSRWATDWNCNYARPIVGKAIDYFDYKKWVLSYLVEEEYNKKYGNSFLMMTIDRAQLSWRNGFNISDIEHDREGGVEYTEKVQVGEETKMHYKGDEEIRTKTITDTSLVIKPISASVTIPEDYDWTIERQVSECTAPLFIKLKFDISELKFVETPDISFPEDFAEKYLITKGDKTIYEPYIVTDFNDDLTELTLIIGADVWFHSNDEENNLCEFEIKEEVPLTLEGTVEYTYIYEEDTEYTEPVYEEYKHNEKVDDNTILGTIYINASGWNRTWVPHTQYHNNDGEYVSNRTSLSFEYEFSRARLRKAFNNARVNSYIEKVLGNDFTDTDVIRWMSETTYNCVGKPAPIQFFNPIPTSFSGDNSPGHAAQSDAMIRKAFRKLTGSNNFISQVCNSASKTTAVPFAMGAQLHFETMCLHFGVRASDHKESIDEYIFKWIKQMTYYTRASRDVVGMWDYADHVTTGFCVPVLDCQTIFAKALPPVENNCLIFGGITPWFNFAYTWAGVCHYVGKSSQVGKSRYEIWAGPKTEGGAIASDLGWIYAVHINADGSYEMYGIEDLGVLSMNATVIDMWSQQGLTSVLDGSSALDDFYAQQSIETYDEDHCKGFIYPLSKDIIKTLNSNAADEIFNRFVHVVDFQWTLYKTHIKWYQRSMGFFKAVLGGISFGLGSISGVASAFGIQLPKVFQMTDPWGLANSLTANALAKLGVESFIIPFLSSIPSGQADQLELQWGSEKMIRESLKPEPYDPAKAMQAMNNASWTKQSEAVQGMYNKDFGAEHRVDKMYTHVAEGVGFNYRLFDNQYLGRDLQAQVDDKLDLSHNMQINPVDISYV